MPAPMKFGSDGAVATTVAGPQDHVSIAALPHGRFVIVREDNSLDGPDESSGGVLSATEQQERIVPLPHTSLAWADLFNHRREVPILALASVEM